MTEREPVALYVVGEPGVGKTTLVERILAPYDRLPPTRLGYGVLEGEPLIEHGVVCGLHLGKRRPSFGGTDALGMTVLPDAIRWANEAPMPERLIGEGARLTHPHFLAALAQRTRLIVVHLVAEPETVEARIAARGSKQRPAWRKGQQTRVRNAARTAADVGVRVERVDADLPADAVEARVRDLVAGLGLEPARY